MPVRMLDPYTLSALGRASFGYCTSHVRASARYSAFLAASIWDLRSSALPTVTFEPNPPPSFGHRKAMQATPKPDRPTPISVTAERVKNWRRVKPTVSGSGGVHGRPFDLPARDRRRLGGGGHRAAIAPAGLARQRARTPSHVAPAGGGDE